MKKWICNNIQANLDMVAKRYKIPKVLAGILVKRELYTWKDMDEYLFPERKDIPDPLEIYGMEKAVAILQEKINMEKSIRIIGDYDVDGVSATYILYEGLRRQGAKKLSYRIPHRVKDGYGLRDYMADEAARDGVDTIITCDNGISAVSAIEHAKELGMTVVLTDHHEVPVFDGKEVLPPADVVVDIKQSADSSKFKEICGATIAWKLVLALREKMQGESVEDLMQFAAIATVCDVMPLKKENRAIVRFGLEMMKNSSNLGLRTLIQQFQFKNEITSMTLGFQIGPCINAAGRLEDATLALQLFLSEKEEEAEEIARELLELNDKRKKITEIATEAAIKEIEEKGYLEKKVLIVCVPDCPESVAGIVAGRIRERYYRPTIIFSGQEKLKGSGRSIPGYHMQQALLQCDELLVEYGGHSQAAGMTILESNLICFREKMNEIAEGCLREEDLLEQVNYDCELSLQNVDKTLVEMIQCLEPIGEKNPGAIFVKKNVILKSIRLCGKTGKVGRLQFQEEGKTFYGVDFRAYDVTKVAIEDRYGVGAWEQLIQGFSNGYEVDVMYTVDYNWEYDKVNYQIQDLQ